MDNRESRQTWAGLFQSSVRIEELESRQLLTAAVVALHVEELRAQQVVSKAAQVSSEAPGASSEQAARESNAEASNSGEDAASASTDDSASAGESRQTNAQEAEDSNSATGGKEVGVERSLARASTATRDTQLEPAAISDSAETIASSQFGTRGTAVFEDPGNPSDVALPTADATPVIFSNSSISEEHSGTTEPQPIFSAGNPGGGFSITSTGILGNATAFAAAIFSSKPAIEHLSGALPGALANLANKAADFSKVTEAGAIEAAAAPVFFFPRINWAGALSDAWDSFAQESAVLPLAEVGRVRVWVVTAAVGAADAILAGYWIWSKRRRRTLFCDTYTQFCD